MTDKEVMQMALDTFNKSKRSHYYCEDRFYSCPKHEEGCADALESDECNCGADTVNKSIDAAIEALRTALAQPEKTDMQIGITYEEANPPKPYCKRCGKKLGTEAYDVHTCTPKFDGCDCDSPDWCNQYKKCHRTMLGFEPYVAPSKKEWVGLTDEEIAEGIINSWVIGQAFESAVWWAEEKLKKKNT